MVGEHAGTHPAGPHSPDGTATAAARIAAEAEDRLRHAHSAITTDPERVRQFHAQVDAIVAEVTREVRERRPQPFNPALSMAIGASRAASGIPPADSLYAAGVLFQAALPVLIETLSGTGDEPGPRASPAEIALSLHRAILRRVVQGSLAYVDFLLARLRKTNDEERRRIARDLHDRVAHGVAIAMQQLELYNLYANSDHERAAACLDSTREALRESIAVVKAVTTELRDTLDGQGLGDALNRYVGRFTPDLRSSVSIAGDPSTVPRHVAEQLYLVLREAIHNAVLHADPSVVDISVRLTPDRVIATVIDDGIGFQPDRGSGIGLSSMRERLELLGGTMKVSSVSGRGAAIHVWLPLTGEP